jgi:ribosomal protein S18 acetylase RimI-like enzyme
MGVTYFKRFRMEFDLTGSVPPPAAPGTDYALVPWEPQLLDAHAEAKYQSFRSEIDANVFPNLGNRDGCRRLMSEIAHRSTFLPSATWLAQYWPVKGRKPEVVGTIQGVIDDGGVGAIQNVGVTAPHRGRGIGSILLLASLTGFKKAGLSRVYLEVTAQNIGAVRLYQRLGFRRSKTVYKAVHVPEVAYA